MSRPEERVRSNRDVPDYDAVEFSAPTTRYCLVVFVLNEGTRIRNQIAKLRELRLPVDVVIADGGSTDGSLEQGALKENGIAALLTKSGAGGLSAQMRMAFDWASKSGYSGVIVIDGNDKDDASAVPAFVELLDKGFDHVQGSRFIEGGRAIRTPKLRYLAVRLVHAPLVSIASGRWQTDTTNGFRGYSMRLIEDPEIDVFRSVFHSYELHYHLAIESARLPRFRTTETPVTRAYPAGVKTPTKITPVRGNLKVLGVLLSAVFGRYRSRGH
ncbi:hypothetical protein GCM10009792_22190 [Microcella alkalica]|uniref:Glycosyltransferase involved in cell wall biosynthesis n=1 Tax=Microcella alkalica TaxID=355930 RepID=A0A839EET3_9MICO|nr:glycosyltransferase family 2 protein [Microcella alkalica]MBA8848138.1 glycosyltransferase involved in cell wall biosynthesis [Microcella alkalica]